MNPTITTIRRLFMNGSASDCAMDAREYKRGGDPKNSGRFSAGGGASSGSKATTAKAAPKRDASAQAFAAGKAKVAENAAKPKKPTKAKKTPAKAEGAATNVKPNSSPKTVKAEVTATAGGLRSRAMEDGKEIGFVTGEIKNGALCIHKSTLFSKEHGKGYGVAMYQALVDKALGQGLRVESDWEPTEQAARMYDALERRGYAVERRKAGQEFTHKPFVITAGPKAPDKAEKKEIAKAEAPKPKKAPAKAAEKPAPKAEAKPASKKAASPKAEKKPKAPQTEGLSEEKRMRAAFSTIGTAAKAVPQKLEDAKKYSPKVRSLLQTVRNMEASPQLGAQGMESIRKAARGIKPVAAGEHAASEINSLLAALKKTKTPAKPKAPKSTASASKASELAT